MRKPARSIASRIEPLEARIAPATLDVVGGALTYTAGAGINNSVTLGISGANYSIGDSQETISLGSGAVTAGFTGGGTNTVLGPNAGVSSLSFLLGDQSDQFQVSGVTDPLAVDGQAGTADTIFITGAINPGGALTLAAESITVNQAVSGATTVSFTADSMAINAAVAASGRVTLAQQTAARLISLGAEVAGSLSLTGAELDRFTTPGVLQVGTTTSGALTIGGALSLTNASTLSLQAGGDITQTAALAVANLSVRTLGSAGEIILNDAGNDVDTISAGSGGELVIVDADDLVIGTVDGVAGLTAPSSLGFPLRIIAGATTQISGARIATEILHLQGAGPYTLNDPANAVGGLSGTVAGAVSYTDADALTVLGLSTTNSPVALTALNGDLDLFSSLGGIGAGTSTVSLTAGGDGLLNIQTGTGVTGTGGVIFTADQMSIAAAVNAGAGIATLQPFESGTLVNLGGADAANTLGLTDAELDFVTAGTLRIGSATAGNLTVSAAINPAGTSALSLLTGGGISITGSSAITVPALTIGALNITLSGANDVDSLVITGSSPLSSFAFNDTDGFTLGAAGADNELTLGESTTAFLTATSGSVIFRPEQRLSLSVASGSNAQIDVTGSVTLNTPLTLSQTTGLPFATEFILLDNDGADAISGTFDGLPEGALVPGIVPPARISYVGGDGNDITISTAAPLDVIIATNEKSATFTDVDGDLVTVKTSKGTLTLASFSGSELGVVGGGQLQTLTLDAGFAGATITITAKPTALGGNGFVNVGFIDASGVDLAVVKLAGDLGRINAGTIAGSAKVPALKSLTVQSIGLLGTSTQISGGSLLSDIKGALGALTIKGDLRGFFSITGAADGKLGAATIGGSIVGGDGVNAGFSTQAGIGAVKIGGDIRSALNSTTGIETFGPLGTITVGGSIVGTSAANVEIRIFGQLTAPTKGLDTALKALTVKGSVEHTLIGLSAGNADASIGSITVGGDWIASSVLMGATSGADLKVGTADDLTSAGRNGDALATIGSFTVKGQAFGTADDTSDNFGIVAEQIGKAKVGGRTFAFKPGANNPLTLEAFFAAPTLDGSGTENPAFDFTIRELGSTTPTVALGGANLAFSTDNKTATFTDVDGDLVTVKRTLGVFSPSDFDITAAASGGGLLKTLVLTPAPGNVAFNLTITAKPGPGGGNGFVNVGRIDADTTDLGNVIIAGELQDLDVGDSNSNRVAIASLTVHSLGTLGGTSQQGDEINGKHGIGKIAVKTDIRSTGIFANNIGGGLLGITVGGSVSDSTIQTNEGIGAIKIGGSFRDDGRIQATHRIASVAIGGDMSNCTIEAFAQTANVGKGPDLVLGKLTIGGSVENLSIILGRNNNADASLGKLAVGREWLASSIRAGTAPGLDTFTGTSDDTKTIGANDVTTRFSTIASIVIKGQALGSVQDGDHFGIVAEVIGKAKIGARSYAFKPTTKESFAGAPGFDWFLREI